MQYGTSTASPVRTRLQQRFANEVIKPLDDIRKQLQSAPMYLLSQPPYLNVVSGGHMPISAWMVRDVLLAMTTDCIDTNDSYDWLNTTNANKLKMLKQLRDHAASCSVVSELIEDERRYFFAACHVPLIVGSVQESQVRIMAQQIRYDQLGTLLEAVEICQRKIEATTNALVDSGDSGFMCAHIRAFSTAIQELFRAVGPAIKSLYTQRRAA